jgi:2-oxoglutarate ferredoxin oxidoreductase subunit gamma
MEKYRIVFSGAGGGVITAAIVLAEAAVMYEHLNATQTQSYGPEARGGATRSDVIIHDRAIRYPKVLQPNMLVCLTQEAYNKYTLIVRPGGMLLTDPRFVSISRKIDARQIELPMYQTVVDQLENSMVFNSCMLGVVLGFTKLVTPDSVMRVLAKRFSRGIDVNHKAVNLGLELAQTQNTHL